MSCYTASVKRDTDASDTSEWAIMCNLNQAEAINRGGGQEVVGEGKKGTPALLGSNNRGRGRGRVKVEGGGGGGG